jgi:hypothetical protein
MKSAYISFGLAALLIIFSASPALAGLSVKGAVFEAKVSPGMQISHEMNVSLNASDVPMDLRVDVFGFGMSPAGVIFEVNPENDTGPLTARPFLHISPTNFHLDPGESRKITLTGRIPDSISDGCRYALIGISSSPIGKESFALIFALNIPILLCTNATGIIKSGKITDLKLNKSGDQAADIKFVLRNTGNAHFKAIIDILLKDELGIIRGNASIPLSTSILPQNYRNIELSLQLKEPLIPGNYTIECRAFLKDGTLLDEMTGYYVQPRQSSSATGDNLI